MPRIDVDLSGFTAVRADLDRLAAQQRAAEADVANARSALDAATRAGVPADHAQELNARIATAQAARAALVAQRGALQKRLDELANRFVVQRDPAALVGSLDGHQPLALLPMRLE